jgi:hypothetical protein
MLVEAAASFDLALYIMPPKILVARPKEPNSTATQPRNGQDAANVPRNRSRPQTSKPRADLPRQKLVVRRLPPGLSQAEFEQFLGEEWKLNAGKVIYSRYKPGKLSKE